MVAFLMNFMLDWLILPFHSTGLVVGLRVIELDGGLLLGVPIRTIVMIIVVAAFSHNVPAVPVIGTGLLEVL